ncbi:MAG: LytTR family DNA-binding domain-containing protein [Bacteroidota bacterium]
MTKVTQIPYPRLPLKKYLLIAFVIAAIVNFILIFLQPFGTAQFQHPNKWLILSGYGICVFINLSIFYCLSLKVVHKNRQANWTITREVLDTFLAAGLSLFATYIYSVEIFDRPYDLRQMFFFLSCAFTVAIIPTTTSLAYLYFSWKDVIRSTIHSPQNSGEKGKLILLQGHNKTDRIEASSEQIILAKAQDNYVLLHLFKEEKSQRHIIRSPLKQIKQQLDETQFVQVHRSYIVNRSQIVALHGNKSKAQVQLQDFEKKIPVSRSFYDKLKSIVNR